jgi:hypothetical protein
MSSVPRRPRISLALLPALALALLVTLTSGRSALAQTPTQAPSGPAPIAGLWLVHHDPSNPTAADLAVFQNNGLMFTSETPSMPPDPMAAQAGNAQSFSSQGYGLWQPAAGGAVAFKFLEVSYDQNGDYAGMVSIHGTLTPDSSGNSATGTYTVTVTPLGGGSVDVQSGPITATRVTMDTTP